MTPPGAHRYNPLRMGTIRCNKCQSHFPCACGHTYCHIVLYHKGQHYRVWKWHDGMLMDYERAVSLLGEIRTAMTKHGFNIRDYLDESVQARKVHNIIDLWTESKEKELRRGTVHPSSIKQINGHIAKHIIPFFGDYDVREIGLEDLSDFVDNLPANLKLKSRKNILVTLHSFLTWLFRRGTLKIMPAFPKIELSQEAPEKRVALTLEQQAELLPLIPERHRDVIEFGMETGLRVGELITLKVCDIDSGIATIRRTLSGGKVIETTKGHSSKEIPLSDRAQEIVERHLEGKHPEALVFPNPTTGKIYGINRLNRVWKTHTKLSVTFYEASRHSFITQCVDGGADALQVKELARHTDVRTTQRYYHGSTSRLRSIVNNRGKVVPLKERKRNEDNC